MFKAAASVAAAVIDVVEVFALLQNMPLFQAICPGSLWARDNRWLLSRVQRLAGSAGGQSLLSRLEIPTGTKWGHFVPVGGSNRDKRVRGPFVPVGSTNRDKMPPFSPGWCLQPGQKALAPLSPSLSPRPSHSAHLFSCCSWLGIEQFLLISSPHL